MFTRVEAMIVISCFSSASASSSLKEVDVFGSRVNAESDLQQIISSESFQQSLLVMERSILGNIFHSKIAAYRQLPILEGKPVTHVSGPFFLKEHVILINDCVKPRQCSEANGRGGRKLWISSCGASVGLYLRAEQRAQCQQHGLEQEEPGNRHLLLVYSVLWFWLRWELP